MNSNKTKQLNKQNKREIDRNTENKLYDCQWGEGEKRGEKGYLLYLKAQFNVRMTSRLFQLHKDHVRPICVLSSITV